MIFLIVPWMSETCFALLSANSKLNSLYLFSAIFIRICVLPFSLDFDFYHFHQFFFMIILIIDSIKVLNLVSDTAKYPLSWRLLWWLKGEDLTFLATLICAGASVTRHSCLWNDWCIIGVYHFCQRSLNLSPQLLIICHIGQIYPWSSGSTCQIFREYDVKISWAMDSSVLMGEGFKEEVVGDPIKSEGWWQLLVPKNTAGLSFWSGRWEAMDCLDEDINRSIRLDGWVGCRLVGQCV